MNKPLNYSETYNWKADPVGGRSVPPGMDLSPLNLRRMYLGLYLYSQYMLSRDGRHPERYWKKSDRIIQ